MSQNVCLYGAGAASDGAREALTTHAFHGGGPFLPLAVHAGDQEGSQHAGRRGHCCPPSAGTRHGRRCSWGELPLRGAWGLLPTRRTCPLGLLTKKRAGPPHSRPPCLKARAGWSGRGRQGPRLSPRRDAAWDPGSPWKVAPALLS